MNLDDVKSWFLDYIDKYDLDNENINRKAKHSFRVMDLCEEISISLGLSNDDVKLSMVIGLLHDVGRFLQYTKWKTFCDSLSVDHARLGVSILKENGFSDEVILKAIYNHNKYKIEDNLSERELLFSKIIRDADKLDIMYEVSCGLVYSFSNLDKLYISDEVYNEFMLMKTINKGSIKNDLDKIISTLAFVFDFNYECSKDIVVREKYIDSIIIKFNYNRETRDKFSHIKRVLDRSNKKFNY